MPSQRVFEVAKELGLNRQELVTKINELSLGFTANNYMTKLSPEEVSELKAALGNSKKVETKVAETPKKAAQSKPEASEEAEPQGFVTRTRVRRKGEGAEGDSDTAVEAGSGDAVAPTVRRRRKKVVVGEGPEGEAVAEISTRAVAQDAQATQDDEAPSQPETTPVSEEAASTSAPEEVAREEVDAASEPVDSTDVQAGGEDASVQDDDAQEATSETVAAKASEDAQSTEVAPKVAVEGGGTSTEAVSSQPGTPAVDSGAPVANEKTPESDLKAPAPATRRRRKRNDGSGGARILGQIDTNVVKDRLSAEGKDFSPGPSKSTTGRGPGSAGSRGRSHKRVVEGSDLYGKKRGGKRKKRNSRGRKAPQKTIITEAAEHKRVIRIEDVISVGDLAHQMGIKAGEVAMKLLELGMMATVNTMLDYDTATLVSDEFGYTVENVAFDISNFYDTSEDAEELLKPRPPVITVMGHVDHGKTSLLDAIRHANVIGGEAGGITQHIGAYKVRNEDGHEMTFLDTPGHEAFTQLRQRGAKATDIVVLVIAADDGVMPQTVEAINHSRDAGVPIIVAINKIDKPTANPGRIKQALTEYELIPEEWGGKTLFAEVSAKAGLGVSELLEMIALQAELEELKANPDRDAQGVIIEAELDVGRGPVATMLVQRGTLRQGDIVVSGQYYGRVRTMYDDKGKTTKEASPSTPVEITGLGGIPEAGEPFFSVPDEKDAKRITDNVASQRRKEAMAQRARPTTGSLEDISKRIEEGEVKELNVILKGDVQGSVEAVRDAFLKLGNKEVRVNVIRFGVGGITENDVQLAASSESGCVIVGFNVRPDSRAAAVAEAQHVRVLTHSIIYDAINQINAILESLLSPLVEEKVTGHAEVRDLFTTPRSGMVAGCMVLNGVMRRNAHVRVIRSGKTVHESTISSLRRFRDDVNEVKKDFECGISVDGYNDFEISDILEAYEFIEVAATL